jgi:hypothetical protein
LRRTLGYVLVAIGLVTLFTAPLMRWYVTPRVKKLPLDIYNRAVSDGTGTYLNPAEGFAVVGPVKLRDVHIVKGDVTAGSHTIAVWDSFDSTFDVENHHQLSYAVDRYTFDRRSSRSVNCCGQNQNRTGSLTLTFPLGATKQNYPWWDTTAKRAFPMVYQGTQVVDGLTVYHFHQTIDPLIINHLTLPGKVIGNPDEASVRLDWWYRADTDVLVEPVTGAVVKGGQQADQWLADSTGARKLTVATTDFTQDDATVKTQADYIRGKLQQLQLAQLYLPLYGPVIGLVLLVAGLFLLGTFGRTPRSAAGAGTREPVPATG